MTGKIRAYLEHEFSAAPKTKKILELKEELFTNLTDRYNDELNSGKSETEAYSTVIAGIGDITELIDSIREEQPLMGPTEKERKRNALCISLAVVLYIITIPLFLVATVNFDNPILGIFLMFTIAAVATGLLIYNSLTGRHYRKADDSMVEEFKEWHVKNKNTRKAYKSFIGAYWSIVVAIYFLFSFLCHTWAYSWIIFIVASAGEEIIKGIIRLRSGDDE